MTHEVPEGWRKSTIGDISDVVTKGTTPTTLGYGYQTKGIPFLKVENIDESGNIQKPSTFITEECHCAFRRSIIKKDTILFTIAGTLGRIAVYKENQEANTNQAVALIKGITENLCFVSYYLQSHGVRKLIEDQKTTGAQPNISLTQLKRFPIALPPLPEQKKIAEVLSSVDEAIAATKAVIDQTKQVKKGLLQTLLTKGIGHTKFKQTELGEIPESWEVLSLDDITPPDRKITYGIVQAGPHVDDGVPYIRVSDMNETGLSLKGMMRTSPDIAAKYKRSEVKGDDIVYALRGKIGHVLPVPDFLSGANLTQGTARIAPGERVTSRYLFWVMAAPRTVQLALREVKGSTFKEITLKKLKSLLITVPPIEEQNQIAEKFDGIETALNVSLEKLAQLQVLKSGLMSDLLSGRKRV
ncbi:hypothetical protein TH25_16365 [Thalassospira profundimaris]|uniref:Type I restriction modification DNA specificity domain-containing protein n=1 Tax=Thalassospira profundimaris TaxID=502049 RepID=A0A367X313_9PROT|nr:restriction endonuclease subunit S [Thalassospira profundimaris]RCK47082.1 hypothetical protein TH25_16365 [Thalassospira profundimaris]